MDAAVALQLYLEDLEDRSRRQNLRLRGLPESTGTEDLSATAVAIFHKVLGDSPPLIWTLIEFTGPWDPAPQTLLGHTMVFAGYIATPTKKTSSAGHGRPAL